MKTIHAVSLTLIVLAVATNPADGQTLELFNAKVYDSIDVANQLAYGLYKHGCGLYTSNDGCTFGMSNHILHLSETGTTAQISDVDSYTDQRCRQTLIVDDWYNYMFAVDPFSQDTVINRHQTYIFQSFASGGVNILRQREFDAGCFIDTTETLIYWQGLPSAVPLTYQLSVYDDRIYASTIKGLCGIMLEPYTGTGTITDPLPDDYCHSIGAYRIGNRVFEAAHTPLQYSDTVRIRIYSIDPSDGDMDDIIDVYEFEYLGDGSVIPDQSGFKVVRDSVTVNNTVSVRNLGVLAVHPVDDTASYLSIFDLTDDDVECLHHGAYDKDDYGSFYDVAVLDKYAFISTTIENGTRSVLIFDIGSPENPSLVDSLTVKPDAQSSNAAERYVAQTTGGTSIVNTSWNLQVSRNIEEDNNYWYTHDDPAYSIFANWNVTDGTNYYGVLWHFHFTPRGGGTSFKLGDVNGDNNINISDEVAIINYLTGEWDVAYSPISRYDMNTDGYITWADSRRLFAYLYRGEEPPGNTCHLCPE